MKILLHICIFASFLCIPTQCYNILALFPHPGKSHIDMFLPLTKALAHKGHNVTVVSHFPLRYKRKNYHDISLTEAMDVFVNNFDMKNIRTDKIGRYFTILTLAEKSNITCELCLQTKEMKRFLKTREQYDLAIVEIFNSDCFLGFIAKLNIPYLALSSSTLMPWASERFGNPTHPAYIPNNLMTFSHKMTFLERCENLLSFYFHKWYYNFVITKNDERVIKKFFGKKIPPIQKLINNASLLMVNSHFSLTFPRPLVPNIIEVGGIHIGKPKPLRHDIEKWISESPEGVIYFSLGSMIKGHTFPEDKKQAFLQAFARLPQRVLWKWENETMPGKPKNVMIQKWMPQFDILCHPNVKAFISHGGLLGTTEAVHCGVPIIVMPQYGDQHTNARAIEANGGGVILHLNEATEEKVYEALKTVLDPQFRAKAKELSARFRDRPLPPLETAIYWVEYVARHRGAPHMRSAAADMPFYQYYLLDVISFLLVVFSLTFYINYLALRALLRRLLTKKPKPKTS